MTTPDSPERIIADLRSLADALIRDSMETTSSSLDEFADRLAALAGAAPDWREAPTELSRIIAEMRDEAMGEHSGPLARALNEYSARLATVAEPVAWVQSQLPSRVESTSFGDLNAEELSIFDNGYNAALLLAHNLLTKASTALANGDCSTARGSVFRGPMEATHAPAKAREDELLILLRDMWAALVDAEGFSGQRPDDALRDRYNAALATFAEGG